MKFKSWPNGFASRRFAKPGLAYGLAKGGQTDSQVGSQVAESRKFHVYHWLMRFYNNSLLTMNLCRLALDDQTVKKTLHLLASKFELDQSQRKSTQVVASQCKWVAKQSQEKVQNLRELASPFGKGRYDLRELASRLANPFGHLSQVCMQVLVLQICIDLRVRLARALKSTRLTLASILGPF